MKFDLPEKLTAKSHTGYVVESVETSLKSLQKSLGIALNVKSYLFAPQKAWSCGVPIEGLKMQIALCPIKNDVFFEYIQPLTKAGFHFLSLVSNGDCLNHVAFCTDDYDACRAYFQKKGAVFVFEMEANDELIGYRRDFYAKLNGVPGVIEILENAQPYRIPVDETGGTI